MRIATWNVNSVRARLERVVAWLGRQRPDVVCLQETKVEDALFPTEAFTELGYRCLSYGQKTYNGVAILSLAEPREVVRGFPGEAVEPGKRLLAARLAGVRVVNVYVPNGGEVGLPAYHAKLAWLEALRQWLAATADPAEELALCGDFNVAPEDRDVWDPELWRDRILFSQPEKQALARLIAWGLVDTLRLHHQESGIFTWWDYRAGAFHRGWGLRIDHVFATAPLAARCTEVVVDRNERKGDKPSDHAPVIATFA